jgi:transcriptional regulator with PAS, ATPase and Fis domain
MPSDRVTDEKAVLDAINGGLIVLDRHQRVTRWNAWMEAASGHLESEARGKLLADIFSGADLTRLDSAIKSALTSRASTIVTHAINPSLLPLQTR